MNKVKRAKMVLAMEYIARKINDEGVFDGWLLCGVADGDIPYGSIDVENVDEAYLNDDNFEELMSCFLRRMKGAYESGGLYCDGIVCKDKNNYQKG
jgi:hypothetical protein